MEPVDVALGLLAIVAGRVAAVAAVVGLGA
jgi:hypothetical protein